MHLEESLAYVADCVTEDSIANLRRHIAPEWIEAALSASGTATLRRRRLPAEQVIWLVIGMALFRDRSIVEVADSLDIALPGGRGPTAAPSGISKARTRLGDEALAWLFRRTAEAWAHASAAQHAWRGLSLYGVDGTTFLAPDSEENRDHFGLASGGERGESGYPLVRMVALMALRSHLVAAAEFGPYRTSESVYAQQLWKAVPDNSLTILDRGFLGAPVLVPLAREGHNRHWLTRAKKNTQMEVVERLGPNDNIVRLKVPAATRQKDPSLPETWTARAIHYQRRGFTPQVLLTSLLDPKTYPAAEVIALYHVRWEIELGYGEIKTDMKVGSTPLRSLTPPRIAQELWGVLLAYNLVRLEMERIAAEAGVEPARISFVTALRLICNEWIWSAAASPGAIPRHLRNLREDVKRFILPERRSERVYPRAVKIKMSKYPRKRRSQSEKGLK